MRWYNDQLTDEQISNIKLKTLYLKGSSGSAHEVFFHPLVEHLILSEIEDDFDYSALQVLRDLQCLSIIDTKNPQSILETGLFSELETLSIQNIPGSGEFDLDLDSLREFKKLKNLRLTGLGISEIDLKPIAFIKTLRILNLDCNNLESINLEPIKSCEKMKKLSLVHNLIAELNLRPLSSRDNPVEVTLDGNPLTRILV